MPTGIRNRSANRAPGSARVQAPLGEETGQEEEVSWRQAIVEELWKVAAVCACAFLFAGALRLFRGDNPLGLPVGDGGVGGKYGAGDEL